mmetsp:Transcript_18092/g.26348  ORF Transcript_18092/g.26348 Transcript_18092/m.26348 type:complete len:260 (-) Transcript_18092:27-806(-)
MVQCLGVPLGLFGVPELPPLPIAKLVLVPSWGGWDRFRNIHHHLAAWYGLGELEGQGRIQITHRAPVIFLPAGPQGLVHLVVHRAELQLGRRAGLGGGGRGRGRGGGVVFGAPTAAVVTAAAAAAKAGAAGAFPATAGTGTAAAFYLRLRRGLRHCAGAGFLAFLRCRAICRLPLPLPLVKPQQLSALVGPRSRLRGILRLWHQAANSAPRHTALVALHPAISSLSQEPFDDIRLTKGTSDVEQSSMLHFRATVAEHKY